MTMDIVLEYRPPTPTARVDSDGGCRRLALSAPSGWNQPLSAVDIPRRYEDQRRQYTGANEQAESPISPGVREFLGGSKPSPHSLSPGSARSGSWNRQDLSDDGLSIYTTFDRGYTAAEERHRNTSFYIENQTKTDLFTGIGDHSMAVDSLNRLIRSSLQPYGGSAGPGNKKWLPIDKLFELVNESLVSQELLRAFKDSPSRGNISATELRHYTERICGHFTYKDNAGNILRSSYRSIFAILTLMDQVQDAPEFVTAELSDKDLPVNWRPNPHTKKGEFYSTVYPNKMWKIGQNWRDNVFDSFIFYQKLMLSPFFELKAKEVPFHDLDPDAVLPFIEDEQKTRHLQGGYGSVWRVRIHPAHHDAHEEGDQVNPYFAVKQLSSSNDDDGIDFKNEVNAWAKSVGVIGHSHLIRLLATWRQERRWHMLFPWANGNLRDYWYKRKIPQRDVLLVQWIAKQCLGIARGVRKIHRSGSQDSESNVHAPRVYLLHQHCGRN